MRDSIPRLVLVIGFAGVLAGCGAGSSSLSTGSLFGGSDAKAAATASSSAKPVTATDRAVYAGATAARAQHCSFFFDPAQLRQGFIAAETAAGTPPELVDKATKEYDFTRTKVAQSLAADGGYCTEGRAREIKAGLTRQLAGDFSPPVSKAVASGGFFDSINDGNARQTALDGGQVFDQNRRQRRNVDW